MKSATTGTERGKPASDSRRALPISAEDVGFEPTRLSPAGFQDRCTRPLCESSVGEITRNRLLPKIGYELGVDIYVGS